MWVPGNWVIEGKMNSLAKHWSVNHPSCAPIIDHPLK